jgi:hypothetical protein
MNGVPIMTLSPPEYVARYELCEQLVIFIDLDTKNFVQGILKRGSNDLAEELTAIDALCLVQWHGSMVSHPG